ncbi:MAG: hypothetical protein V4574_02685 [Pseudomonadota bacterium]
MGILSLIALGLAGTLIWAFLQSRRRLDADRDQHHLASMLISIAAGRDEVSRADIAEHLRSKGYARGQVAVRLNHAVKLAGTAASGELHARVVALARAFR